MDTPVLVDKYAGQTFITPITLLLLIIMIAIILTDDNKNILIPFIIISCLIPSTQRIVVAGMDFSLNRILVTVSWFRILLKKEHVQLKFLLIDKIILYYALCSIIAVIIRRHTFAGFVFIVGWAIDTIGFYFIIRILVKDKEPIIRSFKLLAILSIPLACFFFYEHNTGKNLFHYVGGVDLISIFRNGEFRAQGAFSHPIIAGAYWSVCVSFFIGMKEFVKHKSLRLFAIVASIMLILSCSASTPLMSLVAGLGWIVLYHIKNVFSRFKALVFLILVVMQLGMENPLWFLFTKIDLTGGSTGYFRYLLFDQFVRHFSDWFFVGVSSTYYWGEGFNLASVGLADVVIQYVYEGVSGGLSRFILFIIIILQTFKHLDKLIFETKENSFFFWCLGAAFVTHLFNFMGVTYFGQITLFWWYIIGIIAVYYEIYYVKQNKDDSVEKLNTLENI